MFKKTLFILLVSIAVSHAAVKDLVSALTSEDLKTQTQARLDLLAICSNAGQPGNEAERESVCLEICEVLKGNPPATTVIQPMIGNLERIGGEESVSILTEYLNHKDENIRDDARRALTANPSPNAGRALGMQLKMRKARSPQETAGWITALAERNETGASNLIAGYVGNKDDVIFLAAVKALGRLNEEAGIRALADRRSQEVGYRKLQLDAALLASNRKEVFVRLNAASEPDAVQSVALLGLILGGESGLAADAMAGGNPAQLVAVIEAALQSNDPKVCDAIAAKLGTLPPHLQVQALGALEFSGNRAYAQAVEPLLKSEEISVQDTAARALARIGRTDSVEALLANGRPEARRALGRLDAAGVDQALEKVAVSAEDEGLQAAAIEALANRARRDLIPVFFELAVADGTEVPKTAVKAIGMIGDNSSLEQLTELMIAKEEAPLSQDILNAVVGIVRRSVDQTKAIDILVAQMSGASPRSQANILQALVQTESEAALSPLKAACLSSDEQLQKTAVKLLGGWKASNGISVMLVVAGTDSLSMANHVVIMRGVSRLLAAEKPKLLDKELAQRAIHTCRRDEEKQAIQDTLDKAD